MFTPHETAHVHWAVGAGAGAGGAELAVTALSFRGLEAADTAFAPLLSRPPPPRRRLPNSL